MNLFRTWPDVLAHAATDQTLWYQAPMDAKPVRVRVIKTFKNDKLRVRPYFATYKDASFTADAGHLERFRFEQDWRAEWERRKAVFVRETWRRMMSDQAMQRLYAFYVPTDGTAWGELLALADTDDPPERAEPIASEPIPAGTVEQIAQWLNRYAGHLKVIPYFW